MNRVHHNAASEDRNHWSSAQWLSSFEALSVERDQFKSEVQELRSQLDWLRQQIFGSRSERQIIISPDQLALFRGVPQDPNQQEPPSTTVAAHQRRKQRTGKEFNDTGLRFDPDVPLKIIDVTCPELDGPDADQYEIVGYKKSYRLASTPGTSVVLCYRRPVVKHKPTEVLSQPPAPLGPLGHAQADVSFLAGMLVDKYVYHTPLYRQLQKLQDQGVTLSSGTLTHWAQRCISLCGARRMVESGALLVDEVLPYKSMRQWVLSVPFPLRFLFASQPKIMGKALGIVYRTIATHLTHKAGYTKATAHPGAVTLIQRFGSALNFEYSLSHAMP